MQNLRKSFEKFGAHHGIVLISDGNIHPWIRRTEKPNPINRSIKYQGLKIGLGTDCSGGYSPSLINGMRFSIATSNTVALTKKPENRGHLLDYQGAIAMVTRGSAKVCHLEDKVGGFDQGLQFDALRIRMKTTQNFDTELFGFETIHDMIHKFVFLGDDRNIVQVFVNGKCVKNIQ